MHDHRQNFLYALGIIRFICLDKLLALCLLITAESAARSGSAADLKHFTMSDGLPSAGVAGVTFSLELTEVFMNRLTIPKLGNLSTISL